MQNRFVSFYSFFSNYGGKITTKFKQNNKIGKYFLPFLQNSL